jgi:hypothetical protein
MGTTDQGTGVDTRALLSTLWIFVLFNVIFRDIHELFRPGFIEEVMTGFVNGSPMTDTTLLFGGILAEIPIAMVLLSRVLPRGANRLANIVTGLVTLATTTYLTATTMPDLDNIFFAVIEIIALVVIVRLAWVWPAAKASGATSARATPAAV